MSNGAPLIIIAAAAIAGKNKTPLSPKQKKVFKRKLKYISLFLVIFGLYLTVSAFTDNYFLYLITGPLLLLFGLVIYFYLLKKI